MTTFKKQKPTAWTTTTVMPILGERVEHTACAACGKSTGSPVLARGPVKLYHLQCALDASAEQRAKLSKKRAAWAK